MKIRNAIFGAGLWAVAAGAWALSLGAGRGAVVLGAPVDLSFDVQTDPGTDLAASCVTARLMAGDSPVGDAKVRVTPLPEMRGRPSVVRVQAAIAVDEPVLTVTLTAGCTGKVTRNYVFLADLPATVARSTSPVDVALLSAGAAPGSANAPRSAPGSRALAAEARVAPLPAPTQEGAPPPAAGSRTRPAAVRAPAPPQARSTARQIAIPAPAAARPADQARLVVEPLDLWLDRPVALRASPELLLVPADQPSAQREQAAALWKSLNMQPGDIQQESERQRTQEAALAVLRAQSTRDRADAAQARQELEQALNERIPATVMYALGGLLLAALLLIAWLWTRLRGASEKAVRAWRDSVAVMGARETAAHEDALGLAPHPSDIWAPSEDLSTVQVPEMPSARQALAPASGIQPVSPQLVDTPSVAQPTVSVPVRQTPAPVSAGKPGLHIVSPEELFDIQQQAEFFISVGEHEQAIAVLENHIAERGDASPLAYLELLRLYHTLSRVEEFGQLRKEFMQSFNAQVPEFANFHRAGRMLYHYTDALAEIEAEWASPSVLALLEKFLFRNEGVGTVERFDMAAYDELLLLLAIAQTTPASARGTPGPRQRTTPSAQDRQDAVVSLELPVTEPVTARAGKADDAQSSLDSLIADLDLELEALSRPMPAAPTSSTAPSDADATPETGNGVVLDLDLSDPPHLTLSDLPPVPVTTPPPAGQAVGFGMNNDLMELRLELEQQEPKGRRN